VGYSILQSTVPEAMVLPDPDEKYLSELPDLQPYAAIGIGPGIGQAASVRALVAALVASTTRPLVLDADAINCLAMERSALSRLPTQTILTPHLKEFERLVGSTASDDFERLEQARTFCRSYGVTLCLKGAHTAVVCPDGSVHFNSTGNPGMATAGSGDVLTGILTALLAQGYPATEAAVLGVYQHGLAGDRAAVRRGQSALIASDLIEHLGW
jgi:NAD(P)H-hydrate epimerase